LNRRYSSSFLPYTFVGALLIFVVFSSNFSYVQADQDVSYPDIKVTRAITIEDGGGLIINDTFSLSSEPSQNVKALSSFQTGFPALYRKNLAYVFSYNESGRLQTVQNTIVNDYCFWLDVLFPAPVNVSYGGTYTFTVIYVFGGLVRMNQSIYYASFPLYPSLTVKASFCNVSVALPAEAVVSSAPEIFLRMTKDSSAVLYNDTTPLEAFANISSWVGFTSSRYQLFEVEEWKRNVKVDGFGGLTVTDIYQIINRGASQSTITITLPSNASDFYVEDIYGAYTKSQILVEAFGEYTKAKITLRESLGKDSRLKLLITYHLPSWKYIAQKSWQDYTLNVSLARPSGWIIKRSSTIISLPEGAEYANSSKTPSQPPTMEDYTFTPVIRFDEYNLTSFHASFISVDYKYVILWASFRPTLWVGTVALLLGGVFFIGKTSKSFGTVTVPLSATTIRSFIEKYEEARRLKFDLDSLERQAEKGKISRRKYRLQKSSLDGRLSKIQKDLAEIRKEIERAGPQYVERMKRLDTSEAEIKTLENDIARVEERFRRGEISAEARRRLLDEYTRIKERAEHAIDEILLRFREEIV
jgi:hypothetical protein